MDITRDIESLTHFKRNTADFIEQLKASGQPMVLTVNGRAEVVVQDAASYQELLELVDRAQAIAGIRKGLEAMNRGEGVPLEDAVKKLRRKHKIDKRV